MGRRIARVRGDFLQRQLFLDVLLHEMDGSRYDIVLSRFVADGVPVLLQIAQCPEVVVEDGAGVEQVFMAVPHVRSISSNISIRLLMRECIPGLISIGRVHWLAKWGASFPLK